MERTRYVNLPLAGNIQHGIKTEKGFPKELGYFIAKTKDSTMNILVEKFKRVYGDTPTKLKVKFFDNEPLTVRNARYNQSGLVCYCMQGQRIGKEKVKNVWQEKECSQTCEYATAEDGQKAVCTEEGTLKFLLPEISQDRIWIMKIRGITVINRILDYIASQKILGNSLIGDFYLNLKKEEHIRQSDGTKFNNYTIDILKCESNSENILPENQEIANVQAKSQEKSSQTTDVKEIKSKRKSKDTTSNKSKKDTTNNVININDKKRYKI